MAHTEKMSFKQFRDKFSDETTCRDYLFKVRWPEGYICPKCGCKEFTYLKSRNGIFQCRHCHHQTTLTAGTVMHRTHLPITTWFWAIYLVSRDKRGISATQLATELELSYETAWYLLKRIRAAMGQREKKYLLSGITELDDFYYGGPGVGGKRGRGTNQMNIMVALSKTEDGKPQYIKMQIVDDLKGITVGDFAHSSIAVGSTIHSDGYHSYRKALANDYNHHYAVYDSNSDMLHWLHIIVGNAKAFLLGTYHGNCKDNLQSFLDEFCYRFNRRHFKDELFTRLLNAVSHHYISGLAV